MVMDIITSRDLSLGAVLVLSFHVALGKSFPSLGLSFSFCIKEGRSK